MTTTSPRYRGLYSPRDGWKCYADGVLLSGENYEAVVELLERKYERMISPRTITYNNSTPDVENVMSLSTPVTNGIYLHLTVFDNSGTCYEISENYNSETEVMRIVNSCVLRYNFLNLFELMTSYQNNITDKMWVWKDEQITIHINRDHS